jgi:hypothetical protein
MRILNPGTSSDGEEGCDRLFDDGGDDVLIQQRPASVADHEAIKPNYVPEPEIFGRCSKAAFLEAARNLGLK